MMPLRLTRPPVGFSPTSPQHDAGLVIDPSVSVPTAIAHRSAAMAAPVPELDPLGLRSSAYGLRVCPPRLLQPEVERRARKFAHSLKLVLPRITQPASRNRVTRNASRCGRLFATASEPAELTMPTTSMLSFNRIGM